MPTPPPPEICETDAARFEIAPWLAAGGGVRFVDGDRRGVGTLSIDAALTRHVSEHLRLGGWLSPGTSNFGSFDASLGARIELQSNGFEAYESKFFNAPGRWSFVIDGGVGERFGPNEPFWTTRIAAGFTAPDRLYSLYAHCTCAAQSGAERCRPDKGMVSGVRPYLSLQRAFRGVYTEVTFGLEFETIGAVWWLAGAER